MLSLEGLDEDDSGDEVAGVTPEDTIARLRERVGRQRVRLARERAAAAEASDQTGLLQELVARLKRTIEERDVAADVAHTETLSRADHAAALFQACHASVVGDIVGVG